MAYGLDPLQLFELDDTGEFFVEWSIPFCCLFKKCNLFFYSPKFFFKDSSWSLEMHLSDVQDNEYIHIGLSRSLPRPSDRIRASVCVKTCQGEKDLEKHFTYQFDEDQVYSECEEYILMTELLERKSELLPSDVLTIICTLKYPKASDPSEQEVKSKIFNDLLSESSEKAKKEGHSNSYASELRDILLKVDDIYYKTMISERRFNVNKLCLSCPEEIEQLPYEPTEDNEESNPSC